MGLHLRETAGQGLKTQLFPTAAPTATVPEWRFNSRRPRRKVSTRDTSSSSIHECVRRSSHVPSTCFAHFGPRA